VHGKPAELCASKLDLPARLAAHCDKGSRGALAVVFSSDPALGAQARSNMHFINCAIKQVTSLLAGYVEVSR
jgi:hypothetical protein